jgi:phosphohistidine swiveling domain-containing protein
MLGAHSWKFTAARSPSRPSSITGACAIVDLSTLIIVGVWMPIEHARENMIVEIDLNQGPAPQHGLYELGRA